MNVCYLNHDLRNDTGAGRFCLELTNALKKLIPDFDYRVLTHDDDALPKNKLALPFSLLKIRKIFRDYDIIHALDGWPYGVIAALVSLGLKKKLVITTIGTGAVQPLYNFWKQPLLKWAYQRADTITAVSRNTKKEILKVLPDLNIGVINHGVDFEKFQRPARCYEEIENLKPYILSVGAWKARKGFEYSLAAFEEVRRKFSNLRYVIVSNGRKDKDIPGVKFFNNVAEDFLTALYKSAELFILLPQDVGKDIEGFGLVFLEAASAGLPVVSTRGTSAEDVVGDGRSGFLVAQHDASEAARVICTLVSDKMLQARFSREAAVLARSMSWQRAAEAYKSIYKNLYA